jgi:hypothetical protein
MRYVSIYIHKAGPICLVPMITSASPQLVIMQFLNCLSILCCDFFDTELVICASIVNVCSGGNSSLFTLEFVVCICCLNIAVWMEFRSLFVDTHNKHLLQSSIGRLNKQYFHRTFNSKL